MNLQRSLFHFILIIQHDTDEYIQQKNVLTLPKNVHLAFVC